MRILIIGGTGLISNSITEQLLAAGHDITHYNRGRTRGLTARVRAIEGDRTQRDRFAGQMQASGAWDSVIDMICYEPQDARDDIEVFRGRAAHLIVCSTIDVYAKPASRYPIKEDEHHAPLSEYGRKKSLCEEILLSAHSAAMPVTIIRPAHTYGPGSVHRGHVVNCFGGRSTVADRIQKRKPVIVHGDGSSFWTSCHADDVARAFTGALGNEKCFGKAYHATGEEWLTWNRYFGIVAEAMGAPAPRLIHIPTETLCRALPGRTRLLRENFQFNNIFDNTAAQDDLGFHYSIPLLEGMKKTLAWVGNGPGFEDHSLEPWYDELIAIWRRGSEEFETAAAKLDG